MDSIHTNKECQEECKQQYDIPKCSKYIMDSIHTNKEWQEECKQQFRNMTEEQREQHTGLERLRNKMEGVPEDHGIKQMRKLIEEVREEKPQRKLNQQE